VGCLREEPLEERGAPLQKGARYKGERFQKKAWQEGTLHTR